MASTKLSNGFQLKKIPLNQRKRFPLVEMKDFIVKDAPTRRKINHHWHESLKKWEKKNSTSQKISCSLARMSCFSQNCFLLIPKKFKNWCPLAGMWFALKNLTSPNFNNSFHLVKNSRNKTIYKKQIKTLFPRFQYVLVKWKTASTGSSWLLSKRMGKKCFPLPQKSAFLSGNMVFL